jgi:toxin ParE1/3/4
VPRFTTSELAESDLEEIFLYIAHDNRDAAIRFIRDMMKRFDLAAGNPEMGVVKDDLADGIRMLPYKNYNIYYFPKEYGVEVYRIVHSSRDVLQIFGDPID